MPKRDWHGIDGNLVRRGWILFQPYFLESWQDEIAAANSGKWGKPFRYPDSLFYFGAFLHAFFAFRQTEGVLRALTTAAPFEVPDHTTLVRRVNRLKPKVAGAIGGLREGFVIAIDSSGIKVSNRGEWLRKIHPGRERKGWIKLHVAIDTGDMTVVSMKVTSERKHDNTQFNSLLNQALASGGVSKLLADAAYDSKDNFNLLARLGIETAIRPRMMGKLPKGWKDLRLKDRVYKLVKADGSPTRKREAIAYMKDAEEWKRSRRYGQRWLVECFFSSFKRMFGEHVKARKFRNMANELMLKVMMYNMFVGL